MAANVVDEFRGRGDLFRAAYMAANDHRVHYLTPQKFRAAYMAANVIHPTLAGLE